MTEPLTSVSIQMQIMRKEDKGRGMPRKTLAMMGVASEKEPVVLLNCMCACVHD